MKSRCVLGYCVCLLIISVCTAGVGHAASIPAWLDDAITEFNKNNPAMQIEFVDIKDSFVWYTIPKTAEIDGPEIRARIHALIQRHGYEKVNEEELVTTGRPPNKPSKTMKCWRLSFFLSSTSETRAMSGGRMITNMVCKDDQKWFTGFRIAQ